MAQADQADSDQALWRALRPLRSTATYLMTGAHPDDEWNGFLAWLAYGRGVRTVYACTTRGEGGQNALGPARGRALAALRSREMEAAAAEIGLTLRWVGAGPEHGFDDPMHDFGFSKSGEDTLFRWGAEALVLRFVRLIREVQPNALSPTFLDVPGQHGHHRAVTWATRCAFDLAADPAFDAEAGQPAWQVSKLYLPARSGAGGSYDDTLPPPPETVSVDLGARCEALGLSWAQLGERSRRWHASQGMGRDLPDGPRPFPLHLVAGMPDDGAPMDGVVHGLAALGAGLPPTTAACLVAAEAAIESACAAFPDRARVADALHAALATLEGLELPDHAARRVVLKRRQIGRAAALALGITARISLPGARLRAGTSVRCAISLTGPANATLRLPDGWTRGPDDALHIPADAPPFGTQRDGWDPLGGNEPIGVDLRWTRGGSEATCCLDPPAPLSLAPPIDVRVQPDAIVRRLDSVTPIRPVFTGASAASLNDLPPGLTVLPSAGSGMEYVSGAGLEAALPIPATLRVLRLKLAVEPATRVGVIAGEVDTTLGWLHQLDIPAAAVDDATLAAGDLSRFTTLLIGIFAFGQRPALAAALPRLHAWMAAGGSLVTLYHRPADGWDPAGTPPHRLVIGSPSLRFRVTDPNAAVRVLVPDHPLLTHPNPIAPEDWQGWVRERGLYFASAWDPAYTPLLAMADPDEAELLGSLLVAPVGRGRHIHVALALHHQWAALVPGAFRLLANLVSPN